VKKIEWTSDWVFRLGTGTCIGVMGTMVILYHFGLTPESEAAMYVAVGACIANAR
jgi:hypothetical protein